MILVYHYQIPVKDIRRMHVVHCSQGLVEKQLEVVLGEFRMFLIDHSLQVGIQ
jgi:hypothetical protein